MPVMLSDKSWSGTSKFLKQEKGIPLQAIGEFQSLESIRESYIKDGFGECLLVTMRDLFYHYISQAEIARIGKLEWMDEYEELDLMHSHYFISIAKKTVHDWSDIQALNFECLKWEIRQFYYGVVD